MKKYFLIIFLFTLILAPSLAQAADPLVPCGRAGTPECRLCDIFVLINNVFTFVITTLVPAIVTIMVIVAGFNILTAGGNQEKVGKGRKILFNTVVGALIVYTSFIIVGTILGILSEDVGGVFKFDNGVIFIECPT